MANIRKSNKGDGLDFAKLILLSAPYFTILFGNKIKLVLQYLFYSHANLFSYEHTYIIETNDEIVGMLLGYAWQEKSRENLKTGFLLFKKLGFSLLTKFLILIKFNKTIGRLNKDEYYISNIAIYPKYRRKGFGRKLIIEVEKNAKNIGIKRIILDVEKDNPDAIDFYQKNGYIKMKDFKILLQQDQILHFFRMVKTFQT